MLTNTKKTHAGLRYQQAIYVPYQQQSLPIILTTEEDRQQCEISSPKNQSSCCKNCYRWWCRWWHAMAKLLPPKNTISPDFNVNYLGFSKSHLQYKEIASNKYWWIDVSGEQYFSCYTAQMDNFFVTLLGVMQESLGVVDDNTYKLPHMGKDKLCHRERKLPTSITCDPNLIALQR